MAIQLPKEYLDLPVKSAHVFKSSSGFVYINLLAWSNNYRMKSPQWSSNQYFFYPPIDENLSKRWEMKIPTNSQVECDNIQFNKLGSIWNITIKDGTYLNDEKAIKLMTRYSKMVTGNVYEYINNKLEGYGLSCRFEDTQPPTPDGGGGQNSGGQTDNASCSNTGQFGGGGTPLKDIKLFLYANKVTKGTIKLSKPQVEVGTFATDWRPNPSDYVKANSDAYKKIKSLAVQQGQSDAKKYMQIESTDGTLYGVDLWGGDVKKLLEQQQAEIEELKKLVQTLETKINV